MSPRPRVFVTGIGVLCAGAKNVAELRALLAQPRRTLGPVTIFPVAGPGASLPVAELARLATESDLPRTHRLALIAAREAVGTSPAPEAIVLGTTTGGMLRTETNVREGNRSPEAYRLHGLDTVAQHLARELQVRGPVITVSTACSSAAVAVVVAEGLLRSGVAGRVLVGGADSLCRLTFHGFRSLQLLAPAGCAPLDVNRAGMTIGEGAGFLLLETTPSRPALAVLAGSGLSCDAYHTSSPHPDGRGAVEAMRRALADAGLVPSDVDYINLHGTGTPDNDAAEAKALRHVFATRLPSLSSTKGLTGHPLAAAGAIEAVIATVALDEGLVPATTGLDTVDPALALSPVTTPTRAPLRTVVSNSFGFGGNNASIVLQRVPAGAPASAVSLPGLRSARLPALRIAGSACLTAAGAMADTWSALAAGRSAAGFVPDAAFANQVATRFTRRLKRLPRLVVALAQTAHRASGAGQPPGLIAAGTAWGPLAETQDFLRKLFESDEQLSSPTDFIGSVHNAPAAQAALLLGATGPNLTCSAADRSFSQALLCATLGLGDGAPSALVLAAEAHEPHLSPLLEPTWQGPNASDGGAAFLLLPDDGTAGARLRWLGESAAPLPAFVATLARGPLNDRYDAILVNLPVGAPGRTPLAELRQTAGCPLVEVRRRLGEHGSVGATAVAIASHAMRDGILPLTDPPLPLAHRRLLVLDWGARSAALEVFA